MSSGSRFDRTAERYVAHARARDWSDFLRWCEPEPGDRALDVASGPGFLAGALAPRVAEAWALDRSEALLRHAPAGVRTRVGRAETMPFGEASMSLVTCVHGLHHLESPQRALAEMARVLVPGGRLVLEDYLADSDPARARRWEEIERTRDPEHGRFLAVGEARTELARAGVALDAEETWITSIELEPWLAVAGCEGPPADRIRAMVGGPAFELRLWRARFRVQEPPSGSSASVE